MTTLASLSTEITQLIVELTFTTSYAGDLTSNQCIYEIMATYLRELETQSTGLRPPWKLNYATRDIDTWAQHLSKVSKRFRDETISVASKLRKVVKDEHDEWNKEFREA